jgi:hypothetical protein
VERFFRGDRSTPNTSASAATIGVSPEVIARIIALKSQTVEVRAGRAIRKHKLVKSAEPDDLVFQSVQQGKPMNDQNVLRRHIKPAAKKLGLHVNWRCLRTSHATWLVQAGADPKSVQGQMRHSRISNTMEIYAQIVPLAQRRALEQLSEFTKDFTVHYGPISRFFEVHRNGCNRRQTIEKIGGASRDRTDGLVVANDALSQLSYSPLRLGFRFLFYQPYSLSPRRGTQKGIFFQESLRPRFRFYTLLSIHLSIRPACWLLSSALQLVSPYAKSEHPILFRTIRQGSLCRKSRAII